MAANYHVDHTRRRIALTLRDTVQVTDMFASVERQVTDGAWAYGSLVDSRLVTSAPTAAGVRQMVSRIRSLSDLHGPRGAVAMVVSTDALFGMARMYATLGESVMNVRVFRDLTEAERWLDDVSTRA
jgi:hypothetical protein